MRVQRLAVAGALMQLCGIGLIGAWVLSSAVGCGEERTAPFAILD